MTWHPIETAPKDGTQVLLWGRYNQSVCVGAWLKNEWAAMHEGSRVIESESHYGTRFKECDPPSHWMPMPEPPLVDHQSDSSSTAPSSEAAGQ